ncbi:MAG: class I SAM-dependent methyltransferase [Francisellaceae bacterium]
MLSRQLVVLKKILDRFSVKRSLLISEVSFDVFDQSKAVQHFTATAFLTNAMEAQGCVYLAEAWPFDDGMFDIIVMNNVFDFFKDNREALIKEAMRVLNDDGHLVVMQQSGLPVMMLEKIMKGYVVHKMDEYYFDDFILSQPGSWAANLMPQLFSVCYILGYQKSTIPLTPLYPRKRVLAVAPKKALPSFRLHHRLDDQYQLKQPVE